MGRPLLDRSAQGAQNHVRMTPRRHRYRAQPRKRTWMGAALRLLAGPSRQDGAAEAGPGVKFS